MKPHPSDLMKAIYFFALLFAINGAVAQTAKVPSGLYKWPPERAPHQMYFKASSTFFESFDMYTETLMAGEIKTSSDVGAEKEVLIIVKEGELALEIGDQKKTVGPGSVALIMPGEKFNCRSGNSSPVVFYDLQFKSKSPVDVARGKSNGGSLVVDWDELPFKKTDVGGRRDYFNKPTTTCTKFEMHVTTLNEGLPSHAPHEHAEEEIILLIKGNATMNVAGKDYPMALGDFVFAASHDFHGIRNSGKGQCEYFAFQWK
jgi:(S)-ureidoglycine aminohydrolase